MSTTTIHRKLVRDGIPAVIKENGDTAVVDVLSHEDFIEALFAKMAEELAELRAAGPGEQLEELADVHETFVALTLALFSLAATPENENHGAFLKALRNASAATRLRRARAPPGTQPKTGNRTGSAHGWHPRCRASPSIRAASRCGWSDRQPRAA